MATKRVFWRHRDASKPLLVFTLGASFVLAGCREPTAQPPHSRAQDGSGFSLALPVDAHRVRGIQTAAPFTLGLTDANTIAKVRKESPECRLNPLLTTVADDAIKAGCTAETRSVRALPTLLVICQFQDSSRRCVLQYTAEIWGEGLITSTRAYDLKLFGRLAWICADDAHLEDAMEPSPQAKEEFAHMTVEVRQALDACQ